MGNINQLSNCSVRYVTFGCKLNFAETSSLADKLEARGLQAAGNTDIPDLIVVNTCSVTAVADRKCRQAIRSLARHYPNAAIVVTGCYSQLKPQEVAALPGVVLVVGNDRKNDIPDLIVEWVENRSKRLFIEKSVNFKNFEHSCSSGNRTRYFLKVQDGCNYYCSYCTIPLARGQSRSPEIDELVEAAQKVASNGGKEIVLTGVNVGDFGWQKEKKFIDLIMALDKVDGIQRYRISSIEPNLLTNEIISFVAESKHFMPHFHIPLQSGDDDVLRLMRRRYDTALFAGRIESIRQLMPHAFIGVDLIVGMRGETQRHFLNSMEFVENVDISRLHLFPYSERSGTAALNIEPIVDAHEKQQRMNIMMKLSALKEKEFSQRFIGHMRPVLFETHGNTDNELIGHTDNYIKISALSTNTVTTNEIYQVMIGEPQPEQGEGFISNGEIIVT